MKNKNNILKMVVTAILIALTIVLQAFATQFRIGTYSLPLALIVIAVGAILYGPLVGALLGTIWGMFIFFADPSCAGFMQYSVPGTVMAVIGRGFLNGLITGFIAKFTKSLFKFKHGTFLATFIPAILLPFINNIIFFLCEFFIFKDYLNSLGYNFYKDLFTINLLISCLISFVMAPVIVRVVEASKYVLHIEDKPVVEEEKINSEVYSQLD